MSFQYIIKTLSLNFDVLLAMLVLHRIAFVKKKVHVSSKGKILIQGLQRAS